MALFPVQNLCGPRARVRVAALVVQLLRKVNKVTCPTNAAPACASADVVNVSWLTAATTATTTRWPPPDYRSALPVAPPI